MKQILTAALLVISLAACASQTASPQETPQEGVQALIDLFESRDFDVLVRTRYAELSKAESEDQVLKLVERFETRFSEEINYNRAVNIYRRGLEVTPELSEDGGVATFPVQPHPFKLYKMPNGKWGFHL